MIKTLAPVLILHGNKVEILVNKQNLSLNQSPT